MTDPTGRSRAKQLAEELNALWKKPTTTGTRRLPDEAQSQPRAATPGEADKERGGPASTSTQTR
jgi:hypothetical protein